MSRILLVEDDPQLVGLWSIAMAKHGHEVTTASSGREGLEKFSDGAFDLVITDIIMADGDGLEMIIEMRRINSATKILAISGGGQAVTFDFLERAREHGAVATLSKPFPINELMGAINSCLSNQNIEVQGSTDNTSQP